MTERLPRAIIEIVLLAGVSEEKEEIRAIIEIVLPAEVSEGKGEIRAIIEIVLPSEGNGKKEKIRAIIEIVLPAEGSGKKGEIMALLQYRCKNCGNRFEELVKTGDAAPLCPVCGGETERDYQGKVYCGAKKAGNCTHHCATCGGCK